ncbi:MAG TPA: dihydrodipicolinate synthase family protein, partial [candidate division Zixibacteria bacterium]|nr:dihydrodipicolinate synthase family protein [candidate division Zixibacteria bacterium]
GLHRVYCDIHRLFVAGRREESIALFERVKPILDFSNQRLDLSVAFFKRLLHAQGVYATPNCRMPSARIDAADAQQADGLMRFGMELEAESVIG